MADRSAMLPAIPDVPAELSPATQKFLSAVKQIIETREGLRAGLYDQGVTFRDLAKAGLDVDAMLKSTITTPVYSFGDSRADTTIPNPARDLVVQNQVFANYLEWTNPSDSDLYYIEIWCATGSESRDDAQLVGIVTAPSNSFTHSPVSTSGSHTYWVRAVDRSRNYSKWSPPDDQGGYVVPAYYPETINELLNQLTDESRYTNVFKVIADAFMVCFPDGTGTKNVFTVGTVNGRTALGLHGDMLIDGGVRTRMLDADCVTAENLAADAVHARNVTTDEAVITVAAQIANAIIGNAHITDLSAGKITGQLLDAQIAHIDWAKIQNVVVQGAQIQNLSFGQITGQVVNAQVASLDFAKITNVSVDVAQISNLTFGHIGGQIVDAQIANLSMAKIHDLVVDGTIQIAKDTIQTVNIVNPGGGGTVYNTTGRGCKMLIEGSFTSNAPGVGSIGIGAFRLKVNGNTLVSLTVNYETYWQTLFFQAAITQAQGAVYSYFLDFDKGSALAINVKNITVKFTELLTCS